MSQTAEAYICTLEIGTSYRMISADPKGVTLWKLHGSKPVLLYQWLWPELSIAKESIQLTSVRTNDGLSLTDNASGYAVRLAIYTAKSTIFSSPITGPALEDVTKRWQGKQPKIAGTATPL